VAKPGDAALRGRNALDAAGMIVAPGFIDSDSHADWALCSEDRAYLIAPLLLQGITTVVGGACGYSPAPVLNEQQNVLNQVSGFFHNNPMTFRWQSFGEYLQALESEPLPINAGFLVAQQTVSAQVMGHRSDAPTARELARMQELLRQGMLDGALGVSGNLAFWPGRYATADELMSLAQMVAELDATFFVHARAYTRVSSSYRPMLFGAPHNLRSVRDMVELARQTGVRLQYAHLLFAGRRTWSTYPEVLHEFELAHAQGADVSFDASPYSVTNGPIESIFPDWFVDRILRGAISSAELRRLRRESLLTRLLLGMWPRDVRLMCTSDAALRDLEGLDFATIARRLGVLAADAEASVAQRSGGAATVMLDNVLGDPKHESVLEAVISHPSCAISTGAILVDADHRYRNPAASGAFPRVLGHFARERGLFSMEEAVRRMTSFPAQRMGLRDAGTLSEGCWADLVVFDPRTVGDSDWPRSEPQAAGIRAVVVSGEVVVRDGKVIPGLSPGRILRRSAGVRHQPGGVHKSEPIRALA
jgi:N-acyl-D-amino-acid deacylase